MKIIEPADAQLMRSAIQRVATGPELSKNISYEEAQAVMHAILNGTADPVQAGVFLIGLRMKRETDDELRGVLDALRQQTTTIESTLPDVVVVSEPYNGFNRTVQGSLFSLPVLAACGLPTYSIRYAIKSSNVLFSVPLKYFSVRSTAVPEHIWSRAMFISRIAKPMRCWRVM